MTTKLFKLMLVAGLFSLASWASPRAQAATCTGDPCTWEQLQVCRQGHSVACCGTGGEQGFCTCSSAGHYLCAF